MMYGIEAPSERPEGAHRREFTVRLDQLHETRRTELEGKDLREAVTEERECQGVADQETQPAMQCSIVRAAAVQDRPDQRRDERKHEIQQVVNVLQRGIATAGEKVSRGASGNMKDVDRDPGHDNMPHPNVGLGQERSAGNVVEDAFTAAFR
jgi:hypothetical protein